MRQYFVYLATNRAHTVIYTGVTNDLRRRIYQHRNASQEGFTKKYRVGKLVYFEVFGDPYNAIRREKQIKGGSRRKKVALIARSNPDWHDLWAEIC
jgi:putative endonuclease